MKRILALMLALLMLMALLPAAMADEVGGSPSAVIETFTNPDADAKPMARMWFPDAGAGADSNDSIEKQIFELADKGFGGVEVAMLADGVSYNNAEGKEYGWGTKNWSELLKKVLKAAAKIDGGFQVDMTITAHWPPTLNTLDPNDDAASKALSYSFTKITADDIATGTLAIALPAQKTDGPGTGFGGTKSYDHFLFTDTFVAANLAQVSEVKTIPGENGAADTQTYVFDFNSLTNISDAVSVVEGAGYAAGVPDKATADAYGWDYDEICEFFGPESEGSFTENNGKQDAERNRKRMADWQSEYAANLAGVELSGLSSGADIEVGDWVMVSTFYRGTGQSIPGGRIMHNGVFVTNYFNEEGTKAVTDYWDQMLADDPELLALMQANPGYIFEDSIEASSSSSYWAPSLLNDVDDRYEYKDIFALVAASQYVSSGFMGSTLNLFYEFSGDEGLVDRIYEDYNDKLAELYVKHRVTGVSNWSHDALGWGFRGQTYHLPGLEIARAALVADVAESDNMSKGDGVRYQAGTVNISGRDYLTMEAITGPTIEYATMDDVITELGQNYSDGVSRAILHGTPYAKTFNGYNSDWPGWLPFGPSSFGSAFTYRMTNWDDIKTETDYMARIQAVIQNGVAQIDLAVLIDKKSTFDFESGNRFQNLLDLGYSYNLVSESTLAHPNAIVSNGRLAASGPAYKALIVDRVSIMSADGMAKLIEYAEAGLPIIVYDSNIARAYGSKASDDAVVAAQFESLKAMSNVKTADSTDEVCIALTELAIAPYARYEAAQLETTLYTDVTDGTNYYYMFNNAYPENSGMMGNAQGRNYKGEDKVIRDAKVTLTGDGIPYALDPHSGAIAPVDGYVDNGDGTVSFTLNELYGGDSVIYAVTKDTAHFTADAVAQTDKIAADPIDLSGEQWNLVIHSYGPGADENDPSVSKITTVDFGKQPLGKWKDIPATVEQLAEIGVTDMRNVSGVGEYTLIFDAAADWKGAYLSATYGVDQIGSITVNGTKLAANNASDRVDLGGLLVAGENAITIKLCTTLYGRMYVENSGYAQADFGMGGGFMAPVDPEAYYNGLLSVTLTPYN